MGPACPGAKRGVTPEPVEPMTFTQDHGAIETSHLGVLCDILIYNGESCL